MKYRILLIWLCCWGLNEGLAQENPSLSNLRKKILVVTSDTLRLDSLSIVPGSLNIPGISPEDYHFNYLNALLVWKKRPLDELTIFYRVFPGRLQTEYQRMRFDSISNNFLAGPVVITSGQSLKNSIFDFGNINYNGSFGRGLTFGNNQDVVLNSTLNLQMSGYLADSIHVAAAITDSNIPIQPDGNTQNLNEFDKVFIQFKKNDWRFDIGDIDIRQQKSHFLNYYSRLQGAAFEQERKIGSNSTNKLLLSGAIAKGKYTRNVFQGIEGNQGPYRLKGPNNELFFIVLAGTERVYIDGELLQRGEDQDYVINYNTAEITFTPKRMITKDRRIQVEYGYADRNYLNSQLYVADEATIREKLKVRVAAYSNADAKNSPINQTLDPRQKQFLADVGDSVQQALYPSQVLDTFSVNKILYKKIDTVYNSGLHDSVYVHALAEEDVLYNLAFTEVGAGNGNYILDASNAANGKVYKWIAPGEDNKKRGSYEPVILLIAPRKQQLVSAGFDYAFSKTTQLSVEAALSNFSVNTYSSKHTSDDIGYATKLTLTDNRLIKKSGAQLVNQLSYEWVQDRFRPIERLRSVEFYRDWGLPLVVQAANENILRVSSQLNSSKGNTVQYSFETYQRSDRYSGVKNAVMQRAQYGNWHLNNQVNITVFNQQEQQGYYLRPILDVARVFPKWKNYRIGAGYTLDRNYLKYKHLDSLNTTSYSFDIWQVYLKSSADKLNKWGITYYTRSDQYPYQGALQRADRSSNVNVFAELLQNPRHQLRTNLTYRTLKVYDDKITTQQPEQTILSRAEYMVNEWKGLLTGNMLYEIGTGQEQKRDYTYVQVAAGIGEYTWIDYNNNGLQELNEFEIAQFQDQAKYIRVFTPTNEFIKANYLQFNYSIAVNPRASIDAAKATGFKKFLTRWYVQSSLQINKKEMSSGLSFNPFEVPLSDTSLILQNQIFSNSVSFNRFSSEWGIDFNNIRNNNKAFLTYGYESKILNDWNTRTRWNISRVILLEFLGKKGENQLVTPSFDNRNYSISYYGLEPRVSFTKGTRFRTMLGYRYDQKDNKDSAQHASIHSITSEIKYNAVSNSSLTAKFTYSQIRYADPASGNVANTTVSYVMLDALLPGKNFLWTLDFTKRLTSYLELNMQYEGRRAGETRTIHTGRASLRALF